MEGTERKTTPRKIHRLTPVEMVLILCLAIAIVYTVYLIIARFNPYGMSDSDVANEIVYRRLSWEKKSLFPEGYVGPNESMSLRPVLLYWLFYAVTHKYLLSFQLENTCTFFLELAVIYYFLTKLKVNRAAKLFSLFLLITCLTSDVMYVNFWPLNINAQYMMVIFITLAKRISLGEAERAKSALRSIGIILILAAAFGYGTIKMALYLYLPLVVLDMGRLLFHYIKRMPTQRKDMVMCVVSVMSLCVNFLAYAIFNIYHSDSFVAPEFMIVGVDQWFSWETVSSQFGTILRCFGIVGGGKLSSLNGIRFLLSAVISIIELFSLLWLLKNGSEQIKQFIMYWAIATISIVAFHVLTGVTAATVRYYSVVAISIHLLCGCAIGEWMGKGVKLDAKPLAAMTAFAALFLGIRMAVDKETYVGKTPLLQISEYAEVNGYHYVVGAYWDVGVMTGYSDGRLEAWYSSNDWSIAAMDPFRWLIDTNLFTQERLGEPGLLVLTDDAENLAISWDNAGWDSYVARLMNEHAEKVAEIDKYNLYAVTENPYTLIEKLKQDKVGGLPAIDKTVKIDTPGVKGYCYASNAALNEYGELVSDGVNGGFILYGPYSDTVPGVYDITLNFVVESNVDNGYGSFDVALDTVSYTAVTFAANQTSVTLESVAIEAGHQFEARVNIPAGMVIRVQSIEYKRVG